MQSAAQVAVRCACVRRVGRGLVAPAGARKSRKLVAVNPALLAKAGGCETHALLSILRAVSDFFTARCMQTACINPLISLRYPSGPYAQGMLQARQSCR